MTRVYVDSTGTVLWVGMNEDIDDAVTPTLDVLKPDGTEDTWTLTISSTDYEGNLSDQWFKYTFVTGDIDVPGPYYCNPHYTKGSWTGHTDTFVFYVEEKYTPV